MRVVNRNTVAAALLAVVLPFLPGTALAAEGLNLFPNPGLLALNLVAFGLLIWPVNRLLLQPLVRVLAERESRTLGSLEKAQTALVEAGEVREQLEVRLADAGSTAAERRTAILAEGEAATRSLLNDARSVAAQEIEAVRAGIAAELEAARQSLQADASDLAREAAARVLGRAL